MILRQEQKKAFAEEGYIVVPDVVPRELVSSARLEIERLKKDNPPPADHRGFHFYFLDKLSKPLMDTLLETHAFSLAESLIKPYEMEKPTQIQISLILPPWKHKPGGPHIDGISQTEADGRPGTFSMLAGIFLTDQPSPDMGNLWVWPGSHRSTAAYLKEHGPDALLASNPYPPVKLSPPRQVTGKSGDLLLTHYMLGHNVGGNMSDSVRETLYFRLQSKNHRSHWREFVQDELYELAPVA